MICFAFRPLSDHTVFDFVAIFDSLMGIHPFLTSDAVIIHELSRHAFLFFELIIKRVKHAYACRRQGGEVKANAHTCLKYRCMLEWLELN